MTALKPTCVGFVIGLLLFGTSSVFAATSVVVNGIPTSVDRLQEFDVNVLLNCSGCSSDSFLRGVFYSSGTSYFGYTSNHEGNWINASGTNCVQYFKITPSELKEGSWSGVLKIKADIENSFYNGPGEYLFKVGRYSTSCGSPTWSGETTITITGPTATPIPSSTLAPSHTPVPTHTQAPSNTPTKTPTPSQKITLTITPLPKITIMSTVGDEMISNTPEIGQVLGSESELPNNKNTLSKPSSSNKPYIISLIFISLGSAMLALSFIVKKMMIKT